MFHEVDMTRKKGRPLTRSQPRAENRTHSLQFWSGTITFGLVSVPIQMLPAHRSHHVALRELDADGSPVRRRFFCPNEERIVTPSQIVRGFEYQPDRYVVVTDAELEALEPEKSREIDLRLFVNLDDISPLFFERSHYLAPAGDSTKAYRLLARVLEKTNRAGIATFVMRDREYLVAIIGEAGILRGQTLRFLDEVRPQSELGLHAKVKVDSSLRAQFERAIESQSKPHIDTRELHDKYAQRLLKLVEQKRRNPKNVVEVEQASEDPAVDASEEEDGEIDLLETIRRSLKRPSKTSRPSTTSHRSNKSRPREERVRSSSKTNPKPKRKRAAAS